MVSVRMSLRSVQSRTLKLPERSESIVIRWSIVLLRLVSPGSGEMGYKKKESVEPFVYLAIGLGVPGNK